MTADEIRRAELAPRRYGGPMLAAVFALGAWSITRETGSVLNALQEFIGVGLCLLWAWSGWRPRPARSVSSQEKPGAPAG